MNDWGVPVPDEIEIETRSFDLGVLSERVAQATAAVERDREAMEARISAANRKQRTWRVAGAIGATVAPIAVVVAIVAVVGVLKINTERATRTQTACVQSAENAVKDNRQDANHVDSINLTTSFVSGLVDGSTNPDTVAVVQAYVDAQQDIVTAIEADKERVRDCSDDGIKQYFDTHGDEGYLP